MGQNMVQYGIWANCSNNCDFCLREERTILNKQEQLRRLTNIKKNIDYIDWKNDYPYGISLLGGELYHLVDNDLQESFLELIDIIIEKILLPNDMIENKYSTVTNGIYDPTFLYKVVDKLANAVTTKRIDINFSYDLKYRFKTKEKQELVLKNINDFHKRYDYDVGVQMILTQYVIDMWKDGSFDITKFINEDIKGNTLVFLYPHPIETGIELDDFFFNREDFLDFIIWLRDNHYVNYAAFVHSVKNSCSFKHTGLIDKDSDDVAVKPHLWDGKEILNECGHSILYQCYSDTDKCVLCDLDNLDTGVFL